MTPSRPRNLDHVRSAPLREPARRAALEALEAFGDPAAGHAAGREARALLEGARDGIAARLGARGGSLVFTASGTEAAQLAVRGVARAAGAGARVVVSAVEDPPVIAAARSLTRDGHEVVEVPVEADGRVDPDRLATEVRRPGTVLVALQHANQDVGTLQPLAEAAELAHEAGALVYTDASQTAGRVPVDAEALGADLLSISSHPLGGPPGAGALFVATGVRLIPEVVGDEREHGLRSGRQNLPGIAGMAAALEEAAGEMADQAGRLWALSDRLRRELDARGWPVHGHATQRVPHVVSWSVPVLETVGLLRELDARGFLLGAATALPGEQTPHVLAALGAETRGAVRAGLGRETTDEDVDALLAALDDIAAGARGEASRA